MHRRALVSFLGGVTVPWPLTALAQQPAMPVIGYFSSREDQRLNRFGYDNGFVIRAVTYKWNLPRREALP